MSRNTRRLEALERKVSVCTEPSFARFRRKTRACCRRYSQCCSRSSWSHLLPRHTRSPKPTATLPPSRLSRSTPAAKPIRDPTAKRPHPMKPSKTFYRSSLWLRRPTMPLRPRLPKTTPRPSRPGLRARPTPPHLRSLTFWAPRPKRFPRRCPSSASMSRAPRRPGPRPARIRSTRAPRRPTCPKRPSLPPALRPTTARAHTAGSSTRSRRPSTAARWAGTRRPANTGSCSSTARPPIWAPAASRSHRAIRSSGSILHSAIRFPPMKSPSTASSTAKTPQARARPGLPRRASR